MAKSKYSDPRHQPLIDFAVQTYQDKFGIALVVDGRSIGTLTQMLRATRAHQDDFSIEKLKAYWLYALEHQTKFDFTQPPLAWFCTRINRWALECSRNGNGSRSSSTDVAKKWLQQRLKS